MTVDERLEAVARNLEMLTKIHLDNDREYRERFQQLTEAQERNARDIQAHQVMLQQDAENIRSLARIAEAHEHRLDRLEGE